MLLPSENHLSAQWAYIPKDVWWWNDIYRYRPKGYRCCSDANSPGTMYVSMGRSDLWKSTDGGATFTQLGTQTNCTGLPTWNPANDMYSASIAVVEGNDSSSDTCIQRTRMVLSVNRSVCKP